MKTNLLTAAIAAAAIVGLSGAALAQATGPAAQDSTKMNKDMSKDTMSKNGMKGDSNTAPTTGANTSPSQKPMTTPPEPKGKESNSESPKR
jgi:pentapeptide MXKDX repeat protein